MSEPPAFPRVERSGDLALSPTQERLWFLHQVDPGSAVCNLALQYECHGEMDVELFERALRDLVARHESLRTTFPVVKRLPVQRIAPSGPSLLNIVDATRHPTPEAEARRLAADEARRPFDLSRGPLNRVTLFRFGPKKHLLTITSHHIVWDAWSTGIFWRDLCAIHASLASGRPATLPVLAAQLVDVAAAERTREDTELEENVSHWSAHLAGMSPLDLPKDRPLEAFASPDGRLHEFEFPDAVSSAVNTLTRRGPTTLFGLCLAAFALLLSREAGQPDVVIGVPIALRDLPETKDIIGPLLNTLPLRLDLSGQPTVAALLGRTRDIMLRSIKYRRVSLSALVGRLPRRKSRRHPLYQAMLSIVEQTHTPVDLPGIEAARVPVDRGSLPTEHVLIVTRDREHLHGAWSYRAALFEPAVIDRLARRLVEVIGALASADPAQPVSALP